MDLTLYSVWKAERLRWKTAQGLPKGLLPEDLALGAIQKTLEGILVADDGVTGPQKGIRRWNPIQDPSLLHFLKSVVDSDINNLVQSEEHRSVDYGTQPVFPADPILLATDSSNPEDLLSGRQSQVLENRAMSRLFLTLETEFESDPAVMRILISYREMTEQGLDLKPADVALYSGLDAQTFRSARRRIERKTRNLREQFYEMTKGGSKHARKAEREPRAISEIPL